NGDNPLHIVSKGGSVELFDILPHAEFNPNQENVEGEVPLQIAMRFGNYGIAESLKRHYPQLVFPKGLLHLALKATKGPIESIDWLLLQKISLKEFDGSGKTALFHVIAEGPIPQNVHLLNHYRYVNGLLVEDPSLLTYL